VVHHNIYGSDQWFGTLQVQSNSIYPTQPATLKVGMTRGFKLSLLSNIQQN